MKIDLRVFLAGSLLFIKKEGYESNHIQGDFRAMSIYCDFDVDKFGNCELFTFLTRKRCKMNRKIWA